MDTSKGGEPSTPSPKPGTNRSPGDRPKVSPRVPAKPQPPLPKQPPWAAKLNTPTANGVYPETGSPSFPKTPPPLPSLPPCAVLREHKRTPVPTPRRISYLLATSPRNSTIQPEPSVPARKVTRREAGPPLGQSREENADKDSMSAAYSLGNNAVKLCELPHEEAVWEANTAKSPSDDVPGSNPGKQAMAAGRPPPKPPVKPKPNIKNKPLYPVVQRKKPAVVNKPQKSEEVGQNKVNVPSAGQCEPANGHDKHVQIPNASEVVERLGIGEIQSQTNSVLSVKPERTIPGDDSIKENTSPQSSTKLTQADSVADENGANAVSTGILRIREANEVPRRPPRKSRLTKTLSQASFPDDSDQNLASAIPTCVSSEQTMGAPRNELRKQENVASSAMLGQVSPEQKLRWKPSRKAPPPPTLSIPKQQSVDLSQAVSAAKVEPYKNTSGTMAVGNRLDASINEHKVGVNQTTTTQRELVNNSTESRRVENRQVANISECKLRVDQPTTIQTGLGNNSAGARKVGNRQEVSVSEQKAGVNQSTTTQAERVNITPGSGRLENDTIVSECKESVGQTSDKALEGKRSRDSSPQPGKLNIRGLEISMGLSIGKGLQHQLTSKTRPKPKPPMLSPKPKVIPPVGNDSPDALYGETTEPRATRNSSYSQAVQSSRSPAPTEHAHKMHENLADVKEGTVDKDVKLNRNSSYSRALDDYDDVEQGVGWLCDESDSVTISDVTVTASTDSEAAPLLAESEGCLEMPQRPSLPGLVKVFPRDLNLSKLKWKIDVDTAQTVSSGRSKKVGDNSQSVPDSDLEADAVMPRSQSVEALFNVETADTKDGSSAVSPTTLRKANSAGDILNCKRGSLLNGKPIFIPPPPPPHSGLNLNEEIQARNKFSQCSLSKEETVGGGKDSNSNELDDQVFAEEKSVGNSSSDDDYEPIEIPKELLIAESESDNDPDHLYEVLPLLPPKTRPRHASENVDIPPVRPPKRSRMRRPVPPHPPALSPPTTPMSSSTPMIFGSPPLPPRRRPVASAGNSPVLRRSPSEMYDLDGYFQPVGQENADVYSYADLPGYPFEKKMLAKKKASPVLESKSQGGESSKPQNRESTVSITSDRTSGGSHIYEPIGSLNRENRTVAAPEQRVSGKSIFYYDVEAEEKKKTETSKEEHKVSDDLTPEALAEARKMSRTESQAAEQALDTPIPLPPRVPVRLKHLQTGDGSTKSTCHGSTESTPHLRKNALVKSSNSDDYIYPDDPDMVSPENSMYKREAEDSWDEQVSDLNNEPVYHELDGKDESIYHEPDEKDESIYNEPDEKDESIYNEPDEKDESIYHEAEDSAVDYHSGSVSEVTSPSSPPPPVPPRDHHMSEPFPQVITEALHLQRNPSALSDTSIILNKKVQVVPKIVSFESQLTDSPLSLSPASEGAMSPPAENAAMDSLKQRSISNPVMGHKQRADDSFQEDYTSNSSDRPSSWASSGDGFEDPAYPWRMRSHSEDTASVASSLHADITMYLHGSGSDVSETEQEESLREKAEKQKKKILNVAREIMSSEETFVDILKLLNIDFRLAMAKATESLDHVIVPPSVMNQILQYLPHVQNFNEELLADLKDRVSNWENNPRIADIFLRKGPFLKMYTFYIREFESSMAALDEARKKYPEFDTAVKEFEASPRCKNLRIKHYMLKPIQRIPQYRLLLQEYQKYLMPDHVDFKDTEAALVIVSEVADHANQSMKYGDNFKKLWEIQSSLIGQFEVIHPGRTFIKEGMLNKLSRKVMQPRMFFLLSDVLLYTTPVSGGYKLNNHINLAGTRVILPTKEDFQNELSIISTERSFTVSANTAAERDKWLTTLQSAIKDNALRRSSFDVRKLHKIPSVNVEVEKDLTLGTRAPVWVPDVRVSMCMLCTAEFSVTFRRHHCRACGKVVCGYCSDYRAPLRYLVYKAARVCSECYRKLSKEFDKDDFSDISLKCRFRGISWGSYRKASKAKRPAVLQEVTANDEVTDMSGYLKLWKVRKWKKLWFVLKGKALYTFKASEDAAATESIVLLGYEVQTFNSWFEGVEPSLVFEIRHVGTTPKILRTESLASRDKWLNAIRQATLP